MFQFPALTLDVIVSLLLLTSLEVGLGFDNVAFSELAIAGLEERKRARARKISMALAAAMRIFLLAVSAFVITLLDHKLVGQLSGKDILLLAGGVYLLWHGARELYHTVEKPVRKEVGVARQGESLKEVLLQIVTINVVFSLDSVLTALGTAKNFWIMAIAVVLSIIIMAKAAVVVGEYLERHLSLKILVISFLFLIGANLCAEAFHQEMNKAFVYWPALFTLGVIGATIRAERNRQEEA